ncbi:Adenosine deaminase [Candidatus Bipolaricaulis anaerobius]|uniref:adenosine deaminase n=2 Tax=Candidatus Bipolaricaulis anaerobius TaxID=2026885 RepID=A0A2X3K646_9BACT|nr:Adenosine deaminase [Candidatus Bipolaricaulis anaerobius]
MSAGTGYDQGMDRVLGRETVARLPKFDLHVHLDGSLRPGTVRELWDALPMRHRPRIATEVEVAVLPPVPCPLEEYLEAFRITVALLQTAKALERAAWELCEDAASENVIYIEIRFAPLLHLRRGLSPSAVVEAVLAGMRRAETELRISTGLILCAMRNEPTERSAKVARLAGRYHDQGVVGFDLAGPERGFPLLPHAEAIHLAQEAGVHVTLHAGEGCCPEHIGEALDLGAERIGHGVYLFQDPAVEERVRAGRIPLETCPTSNLQISGFMHSLSDHPLQRYLELGIPVTVNTDNRLMSQTSATEELWRVVDTFGLGRDEVRALLIASAAASFAPSGVKDALRAEVEAAL